MILQFIQQTSFRILTHGKEILVDPECIPNQGTFFNSAEFDPDIILLSRHSSGETLWSNLHLWLDKSKKQISVFGPHIAPDKNAELLADFVAKYPQHRLVIHPFDFEEHFQGVQIQGLTNTGQNQLAFFIKTPDASFMHIANASINRLFYDHLLDPIWHKFKDTHPTFLAISTGSTSRRTKTPKGFPYIKENIYMSPTEGANLSSEIKPKIAAAMMAISENLRDPRDEHGFSFAEAEDYYRWAMEHLNPEMEIATLRPGQHFNLGPHSHQES